MAWSLWYGGNILNSIHDVFIHGQQSILWQLQWFKHSYRDLDGNIFREWSIYKSNIMMLVDCFIYLFPFSYSTPYSHQDSHYLYESESLSTGALSFPVNPTNSNYFPRKIRCKYLFWRPSISLNDDPRRLMFPWRLREGWLWIDLNYISYLSLTTYPTYRWLMNRPQVCRSPAYCWLYLILDTYRCLTNRSQLHLLLIVD